MLRFRRFPCFFFSWSTAILTIYLVSSTHAEAQPLALAAVGTELTLFDLTAGTSMEILDLRTVGFVALDEQGTLFVINAVSSGGLDPIPQIRSMQLPPDPLTIRESSLSTPILLTGDLGIGLGFSTMTSASNGQLLLSGVRGTFRLDPTTGQATLLGSQNYNSLTSRDGTIYGIVENPSGTKVLTEVDPATGDPTEILELPDLNGARSLAIDFDSSGQLWIVATNQQPSTPAFNEQYFYRLDLGTQSLELVAQRLNTPGVTLFRTLETLPRLPSAVEIPTLGSLGGITLGATLLALGLAFLRRRQAASS